MSTTTDPLEIYALGDIGIASTDIPNIAYQSNVNVFNGINTFNSDIISIKCKRI